jgi:hypothetical protein
MKHAIRHDRKQETIEAKTRWFRSLSMAERMEVFCEFTDLALSVNPSLKDRKNVKSTTGRIQVISLPNKKA